MITIIIVKLAWMGADVDVGVQTGMQTSKTESVQSLGSLCPPTGARHRSQVLAGHLINLGGQARLAALRPLRTKLGRVERRPARSPAKPIPKKRWCSTLSSAVQPQT